MNDSVRRVMGSPITYEMRQSIAYKGKDVNMLFRMKSNLLIYKMSLIITPYQVSLQKKRMRRRLHLRQISSRFILPASLAILSATVLLLLHGTHRVTMKASSLKSQHVSILSSHHDHLQFVMIEPPYAHRIPRILHHIWFKANVSTHGKRIKGEPVELKKTCLDMNCVGVHGGWTHMHWNETTIQGLATWPLIKQLWSKTEGENPRKFSDIARVAVLWEYGGAYLDSDMACYKPFDMLLESPALRGATLIGGQESDGSPGTGLFINGVALATARHPFMDWLLVAFQRRSLHGKDWVSTGPLVWGQELERFRQAHPDLAEEIRILPAPVVCPTGARGTIPANFSMDPVWTINYFPSTTRVPYIELFNRFKKGATTPRCEHLAISHRIDETLTNEQRDYIQRNRPTRDMLVPFEKIRKSTKK